MDHLIGRRRRCGPPVIYAWTARGIADLDLFDLGNPSISAQYDWGEASRKDDAETTAIAMLAFSGYQSETPEAMVQLVASEIVFGLPNTWVFSAEEIVGLMVSIEPELLEQAAQSNGKAKRRGKR